MLPKKFQILVKIDCRELDYHRPFNSIARANPFFSTYSMLTRIGNFGEDIVLSSLGVSEPPERLSDMAPVDSVHASLVRSHDTTNIDREYFLFSRTLRDDIRCPGNYLPSEGLLILSSDGNSILLEAMGRHCFELANIKGVKVRLDASPYTLTDHNNFAWRLAGSQVRWEGERVLIP